MQHPVKTILLPVEFSKACKDAARYALSLTKIWQAKIHLVHAVDLQPYVFYGPIPSVQEPSAAKEMRETAEKSMDAFRRSLGIDAPTTGHSVTTTESMSRFIAEETDKSKADLIVMATRAQTGLQDFLLGSVAKKVVRNAPCPVITLTEEAMERHPEAKIEKILHPTDFSEPSLRAAKQALNLARQLRSELEVIHVVDDVNLAFLHSHPMWEKTPVREAIAENVRQRLDEYLSRLEADASVTSKVHFHRGNTGDGISEIAKQSKTDLIAMSPQGYSKLKQLLLGSVAERVLATAPCPVLTISGKGR